MSASENILHDELIEMLIKAAKEGIRIGKNNTDGDYTSEGIAAHLYMEWKGYTNV